MGKEQRRFEGRVRMGWQWGLRMAWRGGGQLVALEICPWRGIGASVGTKQPRTLVIPELDVGNPPLLFCVITF